MENLENLKNKSSWGGKRKKSGRKAGSLNKATLEKKKIEEAFTQRVLGSAERLFNSQFSLAQGCSHLYRIDEVRRGKEIKRKHVLVTDPEEIRMYLDEEVDPDKYYYITTKSPDNKAIDSLLDRAFGRAKQKVEVGGEDGEAIKIEINDTNYARIIAREAKRLAESGE